MNLQTKDALKSHSADATQPRQVDASGLLAVPDDTEFIKAAYAQLFLRPPDAGGLVDYRFLARTGYSRLEILTLLANSPEGRANRVVLAHSSKSGSPGLLSRIRRWFLVGTRRAVWRVLERPTEVADQMLNLAGPERYWHLLYQTAGSLLDRQHELETLIHTWRRESGRNLAQMEAALQGLSERLECLTTVKPGGLQGGEIQLQGMRVRLPDSEIAELSRAAAARHLAPGVEMMLMDFLRPGMVVADTAAGCGVFTLTAAARVQPGGKVFAAEPGPGWRALLERNLEANGFSNPSGPADHSRVALTLLEADSLPRALKVEPRLDLLRLSSQSLLSGWLKHALDLATPHPELRILCEGGGETDGRGGRDWKALLEPLAEAGYQATRICPDTGRPLPLLQGLMAGPVAIWLERSPDSPEASS